MRRPALAALLAVLLAGTVFVAAIATADAPPRSVAARLDAIDAHRHPSWTGVAAWSADALRALDRDAVVRALPLGASTLGAQPTPAGAPGDGRRAVAVASVDGLRRAFETAAAGDAIVLAPGVYRIDGRGLSASTPGTALAPIVVRAAMPGTVAIEVDVREGVNVSAPYWTFENLTLRGVCADHDRCEHAFHVVAGATHFVARNNTVVDFNAHFKINGQDGLQPDHGSIDANTLSATGPRETDNPVTDIDLVAASGWTIRGNRIADFVKARGNRTSYGAFVKGGGSGNRFERNVVVCEDRLRGHAGARVGLSLGGGGTSTDSCRDGRCITEQEGGVIDSNLVAACSDDGIYLNRAATSVVVHNTLVDTGGIVVRFPDSSAVVEGNLVDGVVRSRDGGALHAADDRDTGLAELYLGRHPVRELFVDAAALDLRWRDAVPRRAGAVATPPSARDLCGAPRPARPAYGAFEDFARCRPAVPALRSAGG